MIQKLKRYWWVALVVVAIIYILILRHRIENAQDTIQIQNVQISALNNSVNVYKTERGNLIAKINAEKVEKDNAKEALKLIGIENKTLKDQNVKYKKIIFATVMSIASWGNIQTTVYDTTIVNVVGDTIPVKKINDWNDGKLFISNGFIKDNDLSMDYIHKIKFNQVVENRKKEAIVTVDFGKNQNIEVLSAPSIVIDKSKKWYEKTWVHAVVFGTAGFLLAK